MTISGGRTKQLYVFCRVTGFTSDFLSFMLGNFFGSFTEPFIYGFYPFLCCFRRCPFSGCCIPCLWVLGFVSTLLLLYVAFHVNFFRCQGYLQLLYINNSVSLFRCQHFRTVGVIRGLYRLIGTARRLNQKSTLRDANTARALAVDYEIRSRDPGHAHLGFVLWSLCREAPYCMSVPNLKRIALFVQKLLGVPKL